MKPENGQCVHWVANVLHSSEENSFYEEKVCMHAMVVQSLTSL